MASTSFPRRSERLAAKRMRQLEREPLPKAVLDGRRIFLERLGTEKNLGDSVYLALCGIPSTIHAYLDKVAQVKGSNEKAKIATNLYAFLIDNPLILAIVPRFLETVRRKTIELRDSSSSVRDPTIRENLLVTLQYFEYVIAPPTPA
jgi:hypothetical protein